MFFDVGFSELFLLAVLGLLILGPERLPAVARTLGGWVRRGRQMASEFQRELEREVDLTEFKQLKQEVDEAGKPFRDAAQTLKEGNSILDKTIKGSTQSVDSDASASPEAPVGSDQVEHHEPMPSTESSDYIKLGEPVEAPTASAQSSQKPPASSSSPSGSGD
ncbi:MAG: Sec-independent protein translocase protein TatB [Gammaproteobacteria bacterium]